MSEDIDFPDWEQRLLERVAQREQSKARQVNARRATAMQTFVDTGYIRLLHAAAEHRDISVGGYIRRAVARQIAEDLNMDWRTVLQYGPMPVGYGKRGRAVKKNDDGTGFGNWGNHR